CERARIDETDRLRSRAQAVVAVADAPHGHELIRRLQVPAGLARAERARLRTRGSGRRRGVEREVAVLLAAEVLALQLEVAVGRVVVRRPFQYAAQCPQAAAAAEAVGHGRARRVDVLERAIPGRRAEIRE